MHLVINVFEAIINFFQGLHVAKQRTHVDTQKYWRRMRAVEDLRQSQDVRTEERLTFKFSVCS